MNVALAPRSERFIRDLIRTGRYRSASEVVRAALRELHEREGDVFPPGSLRHLDTDSRNKAETRPARGLRVPPPDEVWSVGR